MTLAGATASAKSTRGVAATCRALGASDACCEYAGCWRAATAHWHAAHGASAAVTLPPPAFLEGLPGSRESRTPRRGDGVFKEVAVQLTSPLKLSGVFIFDTSMDTIDFGTGRFTYELTNQIASALGPHSPPPPPAPSGCPGGSLSACMSACPPSPLAAYQACVADCAKRCSRHGPLTLLPPPLLCVMLLLLASIALIGHRSARAPTAAELPAASLDSKHELAQ